MPEPGYTPHIWNRSFWIENTDPESLKARFADNLKAAGFTILAFSEHHFQPQGYTALWLLGESHLALHTFPETGKSYLELSSCNEGMLLRFMDLCEKEFVLIPHSPEPQKSIL